MKKEILSWFRRIKNKLSKNKVTLPKLKPAEIVAELEIQLTLREIISPVKHPSLFLYNSDKEYWVNFITAMCYVESGYNRNLIYMEPAPLYYESIGLLQLSYVDENHYTFCDLTGEKIFDISNNLYCGVGILNILVGKFGTPIFNNGHYWSVLQPKRPQHAKFLAKFKQLQGE
jgi:hypothetical protein